MSKWPRPLLPRVQERRSNFREWWEANLRFRQSLPGNEILCKGLTGIWNNILSFFTYKIIETKSVQIAPLGPSSPTPCCDSSSNLRERDLPTGSTFTWTSPLPASEALIVNHVGLPGWTPVFSTPGPVTFTLEASDLGEIATLNGLPGACFPPYLTLTLWLPDKSK